MIEGIFSAVVQIPVNVCCLTNLTIHGKPLMNCEERQNGRATLMKPMEKCLRNVDLAR